MKVQREVDKVCEKNNNDRVVFMRKGFRPVFPDSQGNVSGKLDCDL